MAETKKQSAKDTKAETKKQSAKVDQLLDILIEYYQGEYGNDARPRVLVDLKALKEGKE